MRQHHGGDGDDESDDAVGEVVEVDEQELNEGFSTDKEDRIEPDPSKATEDNAGDSLESSQLDPRRFDAYWLQRQLEKFYSDPVECQRIAESFISVLSSEGDESACENELVQLLQFDKFELLSMFVKNRNAIVWVIKYARTENPDHLQKLRGEMEKDENEKALVSLLFPESANDRNLTGAERIDIEDDDRNTRKHRFGRRKPKFALRTIDLETLTFQKGGRSTSIRECQLSEGSGHIESKDHEEWHLPATSAINTDSATPQVAISNLPEWAQSEFPGTLQLNRVQSTAYPCALKSDENMLLSAPTGAGKTNVAMLTILRAIKGVVPDEGGNLLSSGNANLSSLKVVYVAPMKALVAEVVENLEKILSGLGLNVQELTGDVSLSRREIDKTHFIVTTPEKWDIITRKSAERNFTRLVRLLIVDEIHLLHDERGPFLESIVGRTLRDAESMASVTRVVGLSATLPNYKDFAAFFRVRPSSGLFYFGAEPRPCTLQQCYVGITSKRALKRFKLMNEITYEKFMGQLDGSNQTIVFVHSRKETAATGQFLIDKAINDEVIDKFLKPQSGSFEIIQSELPTISGKDF